MTRIVGLGLLLALVGCADQSKGAALSACRLQYYLDDPTVQSQRIPDCMSARSFQLLAGCNPAPNEYQWDWHVNAFPFDNPQCYVGTRSEVRVATFLSPM